MADIDTTTLNVDLAANTSQLENAMRRAAGKVSQATYAMEAVARKNSRLMEEHMGKIAKQAALVDRQMQKFGMGGNLGNLVNQFGSLAAAAGVSFGTAELIGYADQWRNLGNRLAAYGVEASKVNEVQNEIAAIAQRSGASFSGVATAYTRILGASRDLGVSQREVALATETVSKALVLNGATTAEVESVMVQLGQALGKGTVNGDELNSILENGRPIAQALADSLGVPIGQLKVLGAEGKISSQQLLQAILQANSQIEASYAKTNRTVSQAFANLQTALIAYIGNADSATGATGNLVVVLEYLTENISGVASAMILAGGALATAFTARGVASVVQLGQAMYTVFTAATPIGRAIRLASVAISGLVAVGASAGVSLSDLTDTVSYVGDAVAVVSDGIQNGLTPVFGVLQSQASTALNTIADAFASAGLGSDEFLAIVKEALNNLIAMVVKGAQSLYTALASVPELLMGSVVSTMRVMTAAVEGAINLVIDKIRYVIQTVNSLTAELPESLGGGMLQIPLPDFVNLGAVSGDGFGEAFAKAAEAQMAILTSKRPDYIGDFATAVSERGRDRRRNANMDRAITAREPDVFVPAPGRPGGVQPVAGKTTAPDRTQELSDSQRAVQALNDEVRALDAKRQALDLVTVTGNAANIQQDELARLITAGVTNIDDFTDSTARLATEQERLAAIQSMRSEFADVDAETKRLQAQALAMQLATTSGQAYEAQVRLIQAAILANQPITQAMIDQTAQMGIAYQTAAAQIAAAQDKQAAAAQAAADYQNLLNGFSNNFADGFMSVVDGSMSAKDAFREMVADMVRSLIRLGVQLAALAAIGAVLRALGLEPFVTAALGAVNSIGKLTPRANGGPVNRGGAYFVGERGPEVFVPGKSGAIIPNKALRSGPSGGAAKVTVNNYSGAQVDVQNRKVGGTDIVDIVVRRVGSEISSGRYDGAMGARYGTQPVMKRR